MVPYSWILESLELVQASDNILEFAKRSMANWQTELTSCEQSLAKVNIRRIFHGDSLSSLLFVICMIPPTHVLRMEYIDMEFDIIKCGAIIMNRGKVQSIDAIDLPSGEKIRETEEDGHKQLGILEYERVKEEEMNEFRNDYFRRAKLVLKSKLNGRNKIMALGNWAVSILRYGAGILK